MSIYHLNLLENCGFCEYCSDFLTTKQALKTHMFEHAEEIFCSQVCPAKKKLSQEDAALHMEYKKRYFIKYVNEEVLLLDVEHINSKKLKGRSGQSYREQLL